MWQLVFRWMHIVFVNLLRSYILQKQCWVDSWLQTRTRMVLNWFWAESKGMQVCSSWMSVTPFFTLFNCSCVSLMLLDPIKRPVCQDINWTCDVCCPLHLKRLSSSFPSSASIFMIKRLIFIFPLKTRCRQKISLNNLVSLSACFICWTCYSLCSLSLGLKTSYFWSKISWNHLLSSLFIYFRLGIPVDSNLEF